jgi:hypothetical protein
VDAVPAAAGTRTLRADDLKALAWRSIGPANMGGRVADIAFAPGRSKTFFVATGTGGLWKTTNAGTTFAPVFDKEATASIGSVVVADAPPDWPGWKDEPSEGNEAKKDEAKKEDKDHGKAKIVWVGAGEGNGRNSSSWGRGVYRSTDGGATFANVGLPDSRDVPRLAVDPKDPDVCFAAALGRLWGPNAERGVYLTRDGGKTWKAVLQIDADTGACDVILDPSNPHTVYAAMYMRRRTGWSFQSGGPKGGIFRSDDGGRPGEARTGEEGRGGQAPGADEARRSDVFAKDPRIVRRRRVRRGRARIGLEDDESGRRRPARGPRGDVVARERPDAARLLAESACRSTDDQRVPPRVRSLRSDDAASTGARTVLPVRRSTRWRSTFGPGAHPARDDGGVYRSTARRRGFPRLDAARQFTSDRPSDPYRIAGGLRTTGAGSVRARTCADLRRQARRAGRRDHEPRLGLLRRGRLPHRVDPTDPDVPTPKGRAADRSNRNRDGAGHVEEGTAGVPANWVVVGSRRWGLPSCGRFAGCGWRGAGGALSEDLSCSADEILTVISTAKVVALRRVGDHGGILPSGR